ncbi:MAG: NAD+ synthase [Nanoarchaeota archaeon]|nr:NAD+ synthase [Nanoarchaeota archaeon]
MKELIQKTKEFFIRSGCFKAVIGLSGGLDSAVVLKILVGALGAENVFALIMPETGLSEHTDDAVSFAMSLGVKNQVVEINKYIDCFKDLNWDVSELASINTKARVRMVLLYNFSNSHNALVVGTSNKSELLLGYGTKYGDMGCDVFVIGDLYKTEVYELAKELGIPTRFIERKPTAELYSGQTDEKELGASYASIDEILKVIIAKQDLSGFNTDLVENILSRMKVNVHKRKMPEVIK